MFRFYLAHQEARERGNEIRAYREIPSTHTYEKA